MTHWHCPHLTVSHLFHEPLALPPSLAAAPHLWPLAASPSLAVLPCPQVWQCPLAPTGSVLPALICHQCPLVQQGPHHPAPPALSGMAASLSPDHPGSVPQSGQVPPVTCHQCPPCWQCPPIPGPPGSVSITALHQIPSLCGHTSSATILGNYAWCKRSVTSSPMWHNPRCPIVPLCHPTACGGVPGSGEGAPCSVPEPCYRTGVTWDVIPGGGLAHQEGRCNSLQPNTNSTSGFSGSARRRSRATALPPSPGPPLLAKAMLSLPPVQKLLRQLPAGPTKPPVGGDTAEEVTSPVLATEAGQPACYSALQADELQLLAGPKPAVATSTGPPLR